LLSNHFFLCTESNQVRAKQTAQPEMESKITFALFGAKSKRSMATYTNRCIHMYICIFVYTYIYIYRVYVDRPEYDEDK